MEAPSKVVVVVFAAIATAAVVVVAAVVAVVYQLQSCTYLEAIALPRPGCPPGSDLEEEVGGEERRGKEMRWISGKGAVGAVTESGAKPLGPGFPFTRRHLKFAHIS